jgi:26S proteasome regulatory subunit N5
MILSRRLHPRSHFIQIFVEVERARITRILSHIKKEQGDINAATDILCELQVETFGSMTVREKTEFLLEQVALCIEKGDWTQAGILSRKISTGQFSRKPKKTPEQLEKERAEQEKKRSADDPPPQPLDDVTDLKLRYYEQKVTLAKHEDKYLDVCRHYLHVLDTEAVEENLEQLAAVSGTNFSFQHRGLTVLGLETGHIFSDPRSI